MSRVDRIQRALLSVSDKRGIVEFARRLEDVGIEIISTGGTSQALREAGITVRDVADLTGFPEMLHGRVKTLHPKVHGGILHRRDDLDHQRSLDEHGILPIDMVVVNLYPFQETIQRPGISREEAVEQIDIGGPCLLRSAAKNHRWVTVVCRPDLYSDVLSSLEANGGNTSLGLRERLAVEAFRHTAVYDRAIASYFSQPASSAEDGRESQEIALPEKLEISLPRTITLRYGENPHQAGGFYGNLGAYFEQLHGKELSYNNIVDLSAAVELIEEFSPESAAAVAIIKHSNPCGVALGSTVEEAWRKALAADPDSASGGIVAANSTLNMEAAEGIDTHFTEIVAAPDFEPDALAFLRRTKKNRILIRTLAPVRGDATLRFRWVPGGLLAQRTDLLGADPSSFRFPSRRRPSESELEALLFAWKVVKHLKSNAIAFTGVDRSLGLGAGQMSRVDAARVAVMKARNSGMDLQGSVVASDAFFPFADGLVLCAEAGATAVIHPGGSRRDDEVTRAADEHDVALVLTGARHFRH